LALGYLLSFFCFSLFLKEIEISVVYAVWSGIGVTGIFILSMLLFGEGMGLGKVICIALITIGIVGLNLGKG
jgi:multidrug transporter EmrE-like cation transporter